MKKIKNFMMYLGTILLLIIGWVLIFYIIPFIPWERFIYSLVIFSFTIESIYIFKSSNINWKLYCLPSSLFVIEYLYANISQYHSNPLLTAGEFSIVVCSFAFILFILYLHYYTDD